MSSVSSKYVLLHKLYKINSFIPQSMCNVIVQSYMFTHVYVLYYTNVYSFLTRPCLVRKILTCRHSGLKRKCRVNSTTRQLVTLVVRDVNKQTVNDICGGWCQLSGSLWHLWYAISIIRQLLIIVVCDVNYQADGDTCGMWCQLSSSW